MFGVEDSYDTTSIEKQISNADTRIKDAGYKKEDSDQRNWFEKGTNLPQGQNWFFDTLELLGRPGGAIKNAIDKTGFKGTEDLGTSLWRGFSGKEKVHGADLAADMGVENKIGKFALGLGADIALDPLTYVPGGLLLKGAKGIGGLATAPVKYGYRALENASPAVKSFRELRVDPALANAKDALGYMFKNGYRDTDTLGGGTSTALRDAAQQTENSRQFMQEDHLMRLGQTARDAGGLDTGVAAGRLVEAPLRQFEDVKGYEFPDGMTRTTNKQDLKDAITTHQGKVKDIGKEVNATKREYQNAIGEFSSGLNKTDEEIRKLYAGLERQAGKQVGKETKLNIREASLEAARIESKLNNFGKNEASLLRNYKQQIKANHEDNFALIKEVRKTAPNGIKGVTRENLPASLHNFVREGGKGIDEVANELGFQYADDLLKALGKVQGVPRKLDNETVESLARAEMERSGALKILADKKVELETGLNTIKSSIKEISKSAPKLNSARASEKAFADIADNPRYKELMDQRKALKSQLDDLKGASKQARADKIDDIKNVESSINALRESLKNPVMIQKELQRPVRELSTDPKIEQAAKQIVAQNKEIVEEARKVGIEIPELEGHMYHILSEEERLFKKAQDAKGNFTGTNQPNKSILNQRQYTGSVEDINEKVAATGRRNFDLDATRRRKFEDNAYKAQAVGQKRLIDYIHAVSLRKQVLENKDFAVPFQKGMNVGKNEVVIDSNNYTFLKESGDILDGVATKQIGGQYKVTKAAKQVLDRYQQINTDEGTKGFLKAYDTLQSLWKRGALFSLGYHARNHAGAMFNNYVGGMNPVDLVKYTKDGFQEVTQAVRGKESELFTAYRKQGLSSSALSKVEFAKFGEEPEKAIERTVKNLSKDTKGQITQRLNPVNAFQTSQEVGNYFDQANRFGLFKWFVEKNASKFGDNTDELYKKAAEKVREVQFDYSKTTPFEKNVVSRVIPFYRWMRNNIPFQIKQVINDPRKYEYLNKARVNAQEVVGLNDDNIPDYMKESFAIPVSGANGKGKMLGLNLPLGDLAKLSRPGKTLVDSVSTLLKTPAELALNYNTFLKKPIEKFAGQEKKYQIPFTDKGFGIDAKTAYALEQATGQIGRGLSGFLQKPESKDQDTLNRLPSLGISSLTKDFDTQKYAYYEKLDELKKLQDLMLYIQQQTGEKPRTLSDIKKAR
ncbi:hypothetical protein [Paenibacillus sp. Soil724D2]|uniref:hypothetical protein n=1 Tax=Paenibacillus sp. (strain Soil724D2) TaxID=1736392 RepID=UPI0012E393FE|nr:hypothetical protein [Paenibacillus sp. Soil724D2]